MYQKTINLTDGKNQHFTVHLFWDEYRTRFHVVAEYLDNDNPPKKFEYGEGYENNYVYVHENVGYATVCNTPVNDLDIETYNGKKKGIPQSLRPEIKEAMYAAYSGTSRPRRAEFKTYKTDKQYNAKADSWSHSAKCWGMTQEHIPYSGRMYFVAPEWEWALGWLGMSADDSSFHLDEQKRIEFNQMIMDAEK